VTFPGVFAFEAACGIFPVLLALVLAPTISSQQLPVVLLAAIVAWYGGEYALARSLGWRTNALFLPACLVRDAFLPVFYVAAWVSARFDWRGHEMDGAARQPSI
jgi:ceramide glucosyltransferase